MNKWHTQIIQREADGKYETVSGRSEVYLAAEIEQLARDLLPFVGHIDCPAIYSWSKKCTCGSRDLRARLKQIAEGGK